MAPSGTYGLYISKALLAVVDPDEIHQCFDRALGNLRKNFELVNDGNAAVTHCKSSKGRGYWIVLDLSKPNRHGTIDAHAGLPHEFGQDD